MIRSADKLFQLGSHSALSLAKRTTASGLSGALNLFVCAADVSSDRVAAALVASIRQLHPQGLKVYGVGGPALQIEGLHSVVSDEQYVKLATAEIIPPTQTFVSTKLPLPGVEQISKLEYIKIFRDTIWEAALHGCSSSSSSNQAAQHHTAALDLKQQADRPHHHQEQQQQQQKVVGGLPAEVTYDAVLAVGSPLANQQLMFALRAAEKRKVARLPVMVQYMPPGLWDYAEVSHSSKAWAQLADHVMCTLPFELAIMEKAGAPASFVGHPILERLLQGGQFGNLKRQVAQLLLQQAASATASSSSSSDSIKGVASQMLCSVGNASAFWQDFDRLVIHPAASTFQRSNPGSSRISGDTSKGKATSSAAAATAARSKQDRPQLLCLLPGTTEAEIRSSMPAFDLLTKELAQRCPDLAVVVIVPDLLVEATQQALQNFTLPAVVAPEDHVLSANALAAAAAAISHPGVQCLRATAAGVPMVCIQNRSTVVDWLLRWKNNKLLPFGCISNLVLGYEAVPECKLWTRAGQQAAIDALDHLLSAAQSAKSSSTTSSSTNSSKLHQQRADLQQVLLKLVPPLAMQQAAAASKGKGMRAAISTTAVQLPSEAAAKMLLGLIALRKQQKAEQMQPLLSGISTSKQ